MACCSPGRYPATRWVIPPERRLSPRYIRKGSSCQVRPRRPDRMRQTKWSLLQDER